MDKTSRCFAYWRLLLAVSLVGLIVAPAALLSSRLTPTPSVVESPPSRVDAIPDAVPAVVGAANDAGGQAERTLPNDVHGPCEILRVVDGDTMDVQIPLWRDTITVRRVRVWGCDTPERKAATMATWKAATEYTRSWSARHHNIRVLYKGMDSLGRQLCMVIGDDEGGNERLLHADLIEAGHAVKREAK